MGWDVSHGATATGTISRSYTAMSTLGSHLAHVLPAPDWCQIARLFRRGGNGDPFTVTPVDAARMARAFRTASEHRLMPDDWAELALLLADAADRAAEAQEPWTWS